MQARRLAHSDDARIIWMNRPGTRKSASRGVGASAQSIAHAVRVELKETRNRFRIAVLGLGETSLRYLSVLSSRAGREEARVVASRISKVVRIAFDAAKAFRIRGGRPEFRFHGVVMQQFGEFVGIGQVAYGLAYRDASRRFRIPG